MCPSTANHPDQPSAGLAIDHVCWLVDDAAKTLADLRQHTGLGSRPGVVYPHLGTRHWDVLLRPLQSLELLQILDSERAATHPSLAAALARGGGLFTWAVRSADLDAVADRLGLPILDMTLPQPDGTLRGWRSVTGPAHLPFFIDYPNNGDKVGRLMAAYEQCQHACEPLHFAELVLEGDRVEMDAWLGPHELPLTYRAGNAGIVGATVAVRGAPAITLPIGPGAGGEGGDDHSPGPTTTSR